MTLQNGVGNVPYERSLEAVKPEVAKVLHPTKNGEYTARDVYAFSTKDFWFTCEKGHEYQSRPDYKETGRCNICIGKTITKENCLATIKPEIAKQWHPTKNKKLTIYDIGSSSNKNVWWICPVGHEYKTSPNSRKSPYTGCKKCGSQGKTSFIEQSIFYYFKKVFHNAENRYQYKIKNKRIEIDVFIPELSLGIEFDGVYHFNNYAKDEAKSKELKSENVLLIRIRDETLPKINNFGMPIVYFKNRYNRSDLDELIVNLFVLVKTLRPTEFPFDSYDCIKIETNNDEVDIYQSYIRYQKDNSLLSLYPEISKEWDYKKNKNLKPEFFRAKSKSRVWWKCVKGHSWKSIISNRTAGGNGCKYCAHQAPTKDTCLSSVRPDIASSWHPNKNKGITPQDVMPGSHQKYWWICENNHDYFSSVNKRTNGRGCPYCKGKKVNLENSLLSKFPEISKEWHPLKNSDKKPINFTSGSGYIAWWLCKEGHEWDTPIKKRTIRGDGCPYCSGKRVTKENSFAALFPQHAAQWHSTLNGTLSPSDVSPHSNKYVYWQCVLNHEHVWRAQIHARTSGKPNCKICSNRLTTKENNLLFLNPLVAKDWDYVKNIDTKPESFVPGSGIKVWWKCDEGHEEYGPIRERVKRGCCRQCKKQRK